MLINIVIVEDEKSLSDSLVLLLELFAGKSRIVGIASDVESAVKLIDKSRPDLVFMDIMLPDGTGLDVINNVQYKDYKLVFTTSYIEYALKAFELSALHYLVKPINQEMLEEVFSRIGSYNSTDNLKEHLNVVESAINKKFDKILLKTNSGNEIFQIKSIIRIEAQQNYSLFHFEGNETLLISRNIQYYENILDEIGFCRVHNSHLVNINHITKYKKGHQQAIVMSDGVEIRIPDSKRSIINEKLGNYLLIG